MKDFTIIIPVYDEERIIEENTEKLISFLDRLKKDYEIIIGNNGSTDSTPIKGKELMKKHPAKLKFFNVNKKGSVGTVFKKGTKLSNSTKIISIDMDLTTELNFIPKCLKLLDKYEMIIGSKKMGLQERPLLRKIASRIFTNLTKLFLGLEFEDYSLGCKGYRKERIEKYLKYIDKGSSYVIHLAWLLKNEGSKIKEIPIRCFDKRESKFNIVDESIYRLRDLLKFWLFINIKNL